MMKASYKEELYATLSPAGHHPDIVIILSLPHIPA